jgi:hypothetical protein
MPVSDLAISDDAGSGGEHWDSVQPAVAALEQCQARSCSTGAATESPKATVCVASFSIFLVLFCQRLSPLPFQLQCALNLVPVHGLVYTDTLHLHADGLRVVSCHCQAGDKLHRIIRLLTSI